MKNILSLGLLMLFFTAFTTAQINTAHTGGNEKNTHKAPAGPEISVYPEEGYDVNILSGEQKLRYLTIFNSSNEFELNGTVGIQYSSFKKNIVQNSKYGKALEKPNIVKERKEAPAKYTIPPSVKTKAAKAGNGLTVYSNDFESGISGWYTETYSGADLWHVSDLTSTSPAHSLWCGIEGGTNYNTGSRVNTAIISPVISIPGTAAEVNLEFWETFSTEGGWDYCMVDISTDNGATWTHLRGSASSNNAPSGNSGGWVNTSIDISPYAGQDIRLRFYFDTKDGFANSNSGWFVDDLSINASGLWLTPEPTIFAVPAGQTKNIKLTFDAEGMNEGTYEADIVINSNDPINPEIIVPAVMHVTGSPSAEVTPESVDFGYMTLAVEATEQVTVINTGTAELILSEIKTNDSEFYADQSQMSIMPGESKIINVSFYSEAAGVYDSELSFKTNSAEQATVIIPLHAEIVTVNVNITANPTAGGLTTGAGEYQAGDPVKVKAIPSDGFIFVNWTDAQGNEVSPFETYTFTMPGNDLNLVANFTDVIPKISVNPESFDESLNAGETLTRTLTVSNTDNGASTLDVNLYIIGVTKAKALEAPYITKEKQLKSESLVNVTEANISKTKHKKKTKAKAGPGASVLYINTMSGGDSDFTNIMNNLTNVSSFENFDGRSATPNVAYMLQYDIVIVATNSGLSNQSLLGDNLADYADLGGSVILMNGAISTGGGWTIAGRITQPDYSPLTVTSYAISWTNSQSFTEHPITLNVDDISTGIYTFTSTQGSGVSLGSYDTGYPIAAYNPNMPIITMNIFPQNSFWTGDLAQLMENSVSWLLSDLWLYSDQTTASIPAGGSETFEITFDATELNEGLYKKYIKIESNDPTNPTIKIPAVLNVTGFPEIELSTNKLDFGQAMLSTGKTMQLEISNPGTAVLELSNISTSKTEFVAAVSSLSVPPETSKMLDVNFYSDVSGYFDGKLSFKTNADDPVFVEIPLQAEITTYDIQAVASPETGGSITGEGTYHENEEVTLTASANTGYEFSHWQDGPNKLYDNPLVFDAAEDKNLTAVFSEIPYEITVLVNMPEAGTTEGEGIYLEGETVTLLATAYNNYRFVNWTEDGTEVSVDAEYIFTAAEDRELTANFEEQPTFDVTFNVDMNAAAGFDPLLHTVYVSGAKQDGSGGFNDNYGMWPVLDNSLMLSDNNSDGFYTLTLPDVEADDYYFNYYFVDAGTQVWETIGNREMSVIDQNVVLNNVWNNKPGYTVNFSVVGANGTLNASVDGAQIPDGSTIAEGKNVEFTAVPAAGYYVKEWTYNTTPVADNTENSYTVANLGESVNVTVEFELIPYYTVNFSVVSGTGTLTATADGVAIADGDNIAGRSEVVFKASPGTNNRVQEWTHNGSVVSNNVSKTYTIPSLEAAADVGVKFETIPSYQVSYGVIGQNGTLEALVNDEAISSGTNVQEGNDVRFIAAPAEKFRVKEWMYNSNPVSGLKNTKYTIYAINNTADVSVEFEQYLFRLAFNVSDGSNPIENAEIYVNYQNLTTDGSGAAELNIENGNYAYSVSHEGYETASGNLTINSADETVDVVLDVATDINSLDYAIEIFPNPSEEKVFIFCPKEVNLQVLDLTGKILENKIFSGKTEISLKTSGLYFLKFTDNKGSRIEKIIIQ